MVLRGARGADEGRGDRVVKTVNRRAPTSTAGGGTSKPRAGRGPGGGGRGQRNAGRGGGRGGGGRGRGGRGRGRGDAKPQSKEALDAELDDYFMKVPKFKAKHLDAELDSYMASKKTEEGEKGAEPAEAEAEAMTEDPPAAA